MIQKTVTQHNGTALTVDQAAEGWKEFDDRTKSTEQGYNSIGELAPKVKNLEENQVTGHEVYSTFADLPAVGVDKVSYKVSNDPDGTKNGFWHWDTITTSYIKDDDSEVQNNLNDEVAKNNSREAILLTGSDGYAHAKRVKDDSGETCDFIPLDEHIRGFRNWDFLMKPNSNKASVVYGQLPNTSDSDGDYTRSTNCDVIDKNGDSVVAGSNVPRLDYRKKFVPGADESYYEFKNENNNLFILSDSNIGKIRTGDVYCFAMVYLKAYPSAGKVARIVGHGSYAGSYGIHVTDTGAIYAGVRQETTQAASAGTIPLNTWVFVEYIRDSGNQGTVYINQVQAGTHTDTGQNVEGVVGFSVSSLYILGGNGELLNGYVKRAGAWNFIPTTQQRDDNFAGTAVVNKAVNILSYGNFDADVGWNKNSNWVISGGKAIADGTSSNDINSKHLTTVGVGKKYLIFYDIISITQGQFYVQIGGVAGALRTAPGSYMDVILTTTADRFRMASNNNFAGEIDNVRVYEEGAIVDLSTAKVANGAELVENKFFDSDSFWSKASSWSISGGVASCDGSQSGYSALYKSGLLTLYKNYVITYTVKTISAGMIRCFIGGSSAGVFRDAPGTYTEVIRCSGNSTLYLEGNPDFVGTVDNVSVREASIWYDSVSGYGSTTRAILRQHNGFSINKHGVDKEPSLLLEGGTAINYFINSSSPASQTISGLIIGETYTLNCKGQGIILLYQTGHVGANGFATETNHFTFVAKLTSISLTVYGSLEWVNLTNTANPVNHIPTNGSSVSRVESQYNLTNLQSKGFLSPDTGSFYVEFGESAIGNRPSGSQYLMLTSDTTTYYYSSIGFWTTGGNTLQIRIFNGSENIAVQNLNVDIDNSKVLITWEGTTVYVYVNGQLNHTFYDMIIRPYDRLHVRPLSETFLKIKTFALTKKFTQSNEALSKTTL